MTTNLRKANILNPLNTLQEWLDEIKSSRTQPNPNCMSVSTVDSQGHPNSRMVLCKELNTVEGYLTFYTNYSSIKCSELENNRNCSALFHWDNFGFQARLKGFVVRCSEVKNDQYFSTRDLGSQIAAWTSMQSEEIDSLEDMKESYDEIMKKFQITDIEDINKKIPRPNFWGGYEIWIKEVELWQNQKNRFHDRLQYSRNIKNEEGQILVEKDWKVIRIQP